MAETKIQLANWLDDLCVRFIVNLPQEELDSVERICFQVEEAQWFYEDFVRPLDPAFPSMSLKAFCMAIFRICPMLSSFSTERHLEAYSQFLAYKTRVPVRGAILLNNTMDHVLLVKGWKKGASWSFPRGKINKDEKDIDCAIREVYEETGHSLAAGGLLPDEENVKSIEVTMREQHVKLYVFRDVSMDITFQAKTRKEISKIAWWRLIDLPGYQRKKKQNHNGVNEQADEEETLKANKLYMVAPFLPQLRKWITGQRKQESHKRTMSDAYLSTGDAQITDGDILAEDDLLSDLPNHHREPIAYDVSANLPAGISDAGISGLPWDSSSLATVQMKRLLGISETPSDGAHSADNLPSRVTNQQQNLIGMLRSGESKAQTPSSATPLIAPLQHVHFDTIEASSPGHLQQRPPSFSNVPPPFNFPLSAVQLPGQRQLDENRQLSSPAAGSAVQHAMEYGVGATHVNQRPPFMPSNVSRTEAPPIITHPVPPVRANGPPQNSVSRGTNVAHPSSKSIQTPVPPAPSQLPQPKLNSHAMNLLSMFKTGPEKGQHIASTQESTQPKPQQQPESRRGISPRAPESAHTDLSAPSNSRPASKSPFAGLVPSTVSMRNVNGHQKVTTSTKEATKSDSGQEALLNLFTKESKRAPPRPLHAPTMSKPHTQETYMDSHAKHTGTSTTREVPMVSDKNDKNQQRLLDLLGHPRALSLSDKSIESSNQLQRKSPTSHIQVPTASQTPKYRTEEGKQTNNFIEVSSPGMASMVFQRPDLTSALKETNSDDPSGSFQEPKIERQSPRRRNKAPKTALQKAEKRLNAQVTPVRILKRPSTPKAGIKDENDGSNTLPSASKGSNVITAPSKTTTPQILRRPREGPDSPSQRTQRPTERLVQQPSSGKEQQRTLLSLLGSSKPGPPSSSAAARKYSDENRQEVVSPVSLVPQSPGVRVELSRSRINSIASPPSGGGVEKSLVDTASSTQCDGTPVRTGRESANSQTPMSPADKGFLVNYLEGVISRGGGSK